MAGVSDAFVSEADGKLFHVCLEDFNLFRLT